MKNKRVLNKAKAFPDTSLSLSYEARRKKMQNILIASGATLCVLIFFFSIPRPEFDDPACTVILAEDGTLLSASIAADEQYRFPPAGRVPEKFARCILTFEDRHFYQHPGINPFSILRAAWNNIKAGRIVEGGSTITMQTVRLSRKGKSRTFGEKIVEAVLSLRLEAGISKDEILSMYCNNAPFGGNVVGLDAAAWRYYGRSADELSWAEAAALAVLPNSPALVFPGRNPAELQRKRDRLLKHLYYDGAIDSMSLQLALLEPLPSEPLRMPRQAPHLLTRALTEGLQGEIIKTSVDPVLQELAGEVLKRHYSRLSGNQIHNAAILVIDVETNLARVYIGNTTGERFGKHVDVITAPRSTGSILKPFLYASLLHEGRILPRTLVPDIPTQLGSYTPKNFHAGYDGAVHASRAISRSLNIPAVRLLMDYGIEKFHFSLRSLGLTTITRSPDNYGLSLILGGAEATLWDLAGVYAGMARDLKHFVSNNGRYNRNNYHTPLYRIEQYEENEPVLHQYPVLDAASIWFCFEAMKEVARPDELAGWQYFTSSRSVAWKTGTSFGHRDAWAIGLNPDYVVAVWAGNASGEGRPNLTGVSAAAPIMFDIFGLLPASSWFEKPWDDLEHVPICSHSGHRASVWCNPAELTWIPRKGLETEPCPYHRLVHLNPELTHRVSDECMSISEMQSESWFVLPPAMEWYYKRRNPFYRELPPWLEGCRPDYENNPMVMLYPRVSNPEIYIPRDLDGETTEAVFEVAHRNDQVTIFWHLNDRYMGQTKNFHKMALNPAMGGHTLTLVDEIGNVLEMNFSVVNR